MSDEQFKQIVHIFRSEMSSPEDYPMVGVISLSLSTILERIEFCLSLGISDFQLSFPCWGSLTDREVDIFFDEICGRFSECRFLHYNLPRSQRVLTGADYARISAAHPNFVAVKYGGADPDPQIRLEMLLNAPELQFFFTEPGYASVRNEAECGLLISTASVNLSMAMTFFQARGDQLIRLREDIEKVHDTLLSAVGDAGHMDGVFDKILIKSHLPEFSLRLLPPYTSADDTCFDAFLSKVPMNWRPQ